MIYLPETYYWTDSKFPVQDALSIVTKTISQWCSYYEAQILTPKKGVRNKTQNGNLPKNNQEKKQSIEDILNWILNNSKDDWYRLELSDEKENNKLVNSKFFKYEGLYCCWGLKLTENEFAELKEKLIAKHLPEDLFYPENKEVITIPKYYE